MSIIFKPMALSEFMETLGIFVASISTGVRIYKTKHVWDDMRFYFITLSGLLIGWAYTRYMQATAPAPPSEKPAGGGGWF
jgi:hypothetical protein